MVGKESALLVILFNSIWKILPVLGKALDSESQNLDLTFIPPGLPLFYFINSLY